MEKLAPRSRVLALIALAILLEAVFVAIVGRAASGSLPQLLTWLTAAGIFYLFAVVLVTRRSFPVLGKSALRFLFLSAVVFRLTLLPLTPTLSHQLWRSHWDGAIEHAGFNPYVYAPSNSLFSPIRTPADAAIPAPNRAAIHPPLAELLFHLNYNWFPGLRSGKILFVIADLLLIALLVRMLRKRQLPPEWALIYAWSPLAIFEVAGNGFMVPIAALLALLALHWTERRARPAGLAIAASALTLWYALALVPVVVVRAGKRYARVLRWGIGLAVLLSIPFWFTARQFVLGDIVHNLRAAATAAPTFNASIYALINVAAGVRVAAAAAAALVGLTIIYVCWRGLQPLRAALWILTVLLLVIPQVHPSFVLWVLPLVVFVPEPAWIYFSVAVVWAYLIGHQPGWQLAEYLPLYALLAWQLWRSRRYTSPVQVQGAHS